MIMVVDKWLHSLHCRLFQNPLSIICVLLACVFSYGFIKRNLKQLSIDKVSKSSFIEFKLDFCIQPIFSGLSDFTFIFMTHYIKGLKKPWHSYHNG